MNHKILLILIVIAIIFTGAYFLDDRNSLRFTIKFNELEPFSQRLPIYYKGFKFGRTERVYPCDNFNATCVDSVLKMKDLKELTLPENMTARIRNRKNVDYIELIMPKAPSIKNLSNNSQIVGDKEYDFNSYLKNEVNTGGFDEIKGGFSDTIQSAGETMEALTSVLNIGGEILNDIRPSIKIAAENLARASVNLVNITNEIDESLQPNVLSKTMLNIQSTTENVKNITSHADKETVSYIGCLILELRKVVTNVNDIVVGLKRTLGQNFSGMRLMFGKAMK